MVHQTFLLDFSVSWVAVDLGSYIFFVLVVVGLSLDGEI